MANNNEIVIPLEGDLEAVVAIPPEGFKQIEDMDALLERFEALPIKGVPENIAAQNRAERERVFDEMLVPPLPRTATREYFESFPKEDPGKKCEHGVMYLRHLDGGDDAAHGYWCSAEFLRANWPDHCTVMPAEELNTRARTDVKGLQEPILACFPPRVPHELMDVYLPWESSEEGKAWKEAHAP